MTCHYPDLRSASDWSCRKRNFLQPISTTHIWVVNVISMELLQLLLRHHFAGKPVVALFSQADFPYVFYERSRRSYLQ